MQDLKEWSKICKRIYVWDYATNYAHTLGIFPDFGVLQKNMQVFYEYNVADVYEEGNYYMNECDGEFGELRSYLLSKLMQNPYIDYDACMNEFLEAYYGNGWQNIRQFIDMTTEKPVPENRHLKIYDGMSETLGFTEDDIAKADSLWENAKKQAETEEQLANVKRSEICWRYWKGYNAFDKAETDILIEDIKSFGITRINEGADSGVDKLNFYNTKASTLGNNVLFPISIGCYGISAVLSLVILIIALKDKPRKYIYILMTVLTGVFFEIFGWHRRAYLASNTTETIITFALIIVLFSVAGALMTRGKKRIISALLCPCIWVGLYILSLFAVSTMYGGAVNPAGIAVAYILTGIEGIIIFAVTIRNLIKEKRNTAVNE